MKKVNKITLPGYHHNGYHNFLFQKYFLVYFTVQKLRQWVWINYYWSTHTQWKFPQSKPNYSRKVKCGFSYNIIIYCNIPVQHISAILKKIVLIDILLFIIRCDKCFWEETFAFFGWRLNDVSRNFLGIPFSARDFRAGAQKDITQSPFTCSKLTIETLQQGVKYVQN